MPYKSQAQAKALGGPAKVKEWDKASAGMKLPAKAKAKAHKAAGIPAHGGKTTIGAMMQNMVG